MSKKFEKNVKELTLGTERVKKKKKNKTIREGAVFNYGEPALWWACFDSYGTYCITNEY